MPVPLSGTGSPRRMNSALEIGSSKACNLYLLAMRIQLSSRRHASLEKRPGFTAQRLGENALGVDERDSPARAAGVMSP